LLRLLSVVLGLLTVVLTHVAARLATGRADIALAAAAFVALLPKLNVVSAVVTNDALVIPLSSLALVGTLAYVRARGCSSVRAAALASGVGLTLGAATLTKLNALPLIPVLLGGLFLARTSLSRRVRDAGLAVAGWFAACGWWFVHNTREYGDPLAREATRAYLDELVPSLIVPVPWFDTERFLYFVPQSLVETSWYNAGWNQLFAPFAFNLVLALVAAVAVFSGLRAFATGPASRLWPLDRRLRARFWTSSRADHRQGHDAGTGSLDVHRSECFRHDCRARTRGRIRAIRSGAALRTLALSCIAAPAERLRAHAVRTSVPRPLATHVFTSFRGSAPASDVGSGRFPRASVQRHGSSATRRRGRTAALLRACSGRSALAAVALGNGTTSIRLRIGSSSAAAPSRRPRADSIPSQ
jgi:hypothetical protein